MMPMPIITQYKYFRCLWTLVSSICLYLFSIYEANNSYCDKECIIIDVAVQMPRSHFANKRQQHVKFVVRMNCLEKFIHELP